VSSTSQGRQAEKAAANYLESRGFQILESNWRTPWCEIDIIAQQNNTIYFVEVKYRRDSLQGSGFDYITPSKLNQMARAAESWVQQNKWLQSYQLAAIEVEGQDYTIMHFIDSV
jgi:putative endonuclease